MMSPCPTTAVGVASRLAPTGNLFPFRGVLVPLRRSKQSYRCIRCHTTLESQAEPANRREPEASEAPTAPVTLKPPPSRRPAPIYRAPPSYTPGDDSRPGERRGPEGAPRGQPGTRPDRRPNNRGPPGGARPPPSGTRPPGSPQQPSNGSSGQPYQRSASQTANRGRQARGAYNTRPPSRNPPVPITPAATESPQAASNGTAQNGRGKGGPGPSIPQEKEKKQEWVDLDSRRRARLNRRSERREERLANVAVREEIFEVGPEGMAVGDLAAMLAIPAVDVVKYLFLNGVMAAINATLDPDTVKAVGKEYGVEVLDRDVADVASGAVKSLDLSLDEDEVAVPRPPVVAVMGHVDHGKTSLLDHIRSTRVAAGEAGGITQSIGAYTCAVDSGGERRAITFLDTPGHEAFGAMRARGARVTDVAVLVVAADDGVRPQTREAAAHARAAGVPIVVAINKVDKPGADVPRVMQELAAEDLVPEAWGGKTPVVEISAKRGTGIDGLLEVVLLVAELEELVACPDRPALGTVLEARMDRRQGACATLLVQTGTLRLGDMVAAGQAYGRVRSMQSAGGAVDSAGPSTAVAMLGLSEVPTAGDEFTVHASEAAARAAASLARDSRRLDRLADLASGGSMVTLSSLASSDSGDEEGPGGPGDGGAGAGQALMHMNLVLKADASGSVEAVRGALAALPQGAVVLRYLLAAPGEVSESDVALASASGGVVLAFQTRAGEAAALAAKQAGVELRAYSVIYDLVDDVRAAMEGRLTSVQETVPLGEAVVKATFGGGARRVAGCEVTEGALRKGASLRVWRGATLVHEGTLTSLRRVKEDVASVAAGTECGVSVPDFHGWEAGDRLEAFKLVQKKQKLEQAQAAVASFGD
ncbi:CIF2 [Auxenochlorella protothecoides x Auxenochlorella symbiontica]